MNGIIDAEGMLVVERKGKMIEQWCPFNETRCGDHCPHFFEGEVATLGEEGVDKSMSVRLMCGPVWIAPGAVIPILEDKRRSDEKDGKPDRENISGESSDPRDASRDRD